VFGAGIGVHVVRAGYFAGWRDGLVASAVVQIMRAIV
jgi:hypothetical protein